MLMNLLRYDYWLDPLERERLVFLIAALSALIVVARLASSRVRLRTALTLSVHALLSAAALVNMPRFAPDSAIAALALGPLLAAAITLTGRAKAGRARYVLRALAPFALGYAVSLLSAARLDVSALGQLNGVLSPPIAWLVASGIAIARAARDALDSDARFIRAGSAALLAATVAWSIFAAATMRSHGVTASDPYAYAQMGVDLAERGKVAHSFPLVEVTYALGIPSDPVVHQGYKLPQDARRIAPTVWPIGYAWFTAAAWRVGGETALLWLTPLFAIASLALLFPILRRIARDTVGDGADAAAVLAVMLTATSQLQVSWQMVPMADFAAQVFTWLALGCALAAADRSQSRGVLALAALSGVALGMAFNVRYTQVLIAPGLALALWRAPTARIRAIALCGAAALIAVLPTFAHHAAWFGGALRTGSDELQHFALTNVLPMTRSMLEQLLSYREFGLLAPLLAVGALALLQRNGAMSATLIAFALPVGVLHVLYGYLRARDLIFLLPLGALFASIGVVWLWQRAQRAAQSWRAALVIAVALACVLRSMETLAWPVAGGFSIFGHLLLEQRSALDAIASATPADAVIGSTLNSGAIDLHAGRASFRPADWRPSELRAFVDAMHARGQPVFVLLDGDALIPVESNLAAQYALSIVDRYPMPYFEAVGGGSTARLVRLVRVDPR